MADDDDEDWGDHEGPEEVCPAWQGYKLPFSVESDAVFTRTEQLATTLFLLREVFFLPSSFP
jgi:hypothetical protein